MFPNHNDQNFTNLVFNKIMKLLFLVSKAEYSSGVSSKESIISINYVLEEIHNLV